MGLLAYWVIVLFVISLGVVPSFAESNTYLFEDNTGMNYTVSYYIKNATVSNMAIDHNQNSLFIDISATGDGTLTVTLPRALVDAKMGNLTTDEQFFVLADDISTNFQESKTSLDRTLSVPFSEGTQKIEIIGTNSTQVKVVPEFGPILYITLTASIISIIAISTKTRFRFDY